MCVPCGHCDEWDAYYAALNVELPSLSRPMSFIQNFLSDIRGLSQVKENDFVIFVVGPTGSGKSWFTGEFCNNDDVRVGGDSEKIRTKNVQALKCNFGRGLNSVVLVDTPSFCTGIKGFAELEMTNWIRSRFNKRCCDSGILFLQSLWWDPSHRDVLIARHLETFASIFPNGFAPPSRVYVIPTKESDVIIPREEMNRRISNLECTSLAVNKNGNGRWRVSMLPEVFTGQPETTASVVQSIIINMVNGKAGGTITPPRTSLKPNCLDSVSNPAGPTRGHSRKETNNDSDEVIRSKRVALQFTPPGHPQRRSALVDLGNLLNEQLRKQGQQGDLGEVIALKRAALELIPLDAPERIAALAELTNLVSQRLLENPELDEIVVLRRIALELTPLGHPDRRSALNNLADILFERFRKGRLKVDLDEIITLKRAAMELTPLGCQDDYVTLASLANFLCKRFDDGEWNVELDKIIALRRDLLEFMPPGHPQRRSALVNLAGPLSQRFKRDGMKADLDMAISLKRAVLELTPLEDLDRYSALINLADLLSQRFGKQAALDEIVTLRRAALDLTPKGHSQRCSALVNLADLLSERSRKGGMKADLDETISLQKAALESMLSRPLERRSILAHLRDHLCQRFKRDGAISDLAEVISLQRAVLELTPEDPDRRLALINLVDRLSDRFRIEGGKEDLDEMVSLQRAVLESTPSDHPDYRSALIGLAALLSQRFNKEKMKSDLNLIISLRRNVLDLTPPQHPYHLIALHCLADLLEVRFQEGGAEEDLDEIIPLTRNLLDSTSSGDPERRPILLKLTRYLSERFKLQGATADLTEIILIQRAVLKLAPPEHPDRFTTLAILADCLSEWFKREEDKVVLDEIITLRRAALECIPSGDARRRSILVNLSDCTYQRYRMESSMADLTETIALQRAVLEVTDPGDTDRCSALINCASSLSERFEQEGANADLDEVVRLRRAALDSVAEDDPRRQQILANLDDCLYERFRREGAVADLEEIITLRRAALERTPLPQQCRPLNLAGSLHEKFQKLSSATDIEEAIKLGRAALALCDSGHPDHTLSRDCLTNYLTAKIRKRGPKLPVPGASTSSSSRYHVKQLIRSIVFETLENLPLRLVHTTTGILCNRDAQLSHFEASPQYCQLLSSISGLDGQLREARIRDAVVNFFRYVMLSHRWGSSEPLLRDVEGTNVYDLSGTDCLAKLQEFCLCALRRGFLWAWSDTCCIDKDSSAELQEAIGSMFSWYRRSSLTLVYLSDVSGACSPADSVWFKRGWTLQELLASPTILFYTRDWSLCMNREVANHKADPTMLAELQKATGIAEWHLTNFYPGMDEARSRLQWASSRRTTRPEDVAYSLFGIFKLHLPVLYGESAESALGRLLAEIISRSGDISVLDWVGEASSIHSCFPANLAPYQTLPCVPATASDASGRNGLDLEKAQKLYSSLAKLPRARFVNQRLSLPCIAHWVTTVKPLHTNSTSPSCCMYEICAPLLRPIKVTLSVNLEETSGSYVLVRPWHPKWLEAQADSDIDAPWKLLEQLEQSFNALLLRRLPHNEYERIASDSEIVARVQDLDSILDSEVMVPDIV
ncbi:hypothetical protein F5J12DRAFT_742713 [Pisolithus orientalis]|uniref:uncharacterized protein n=1 Tax=Pisolithus orientalis TaxID=936130 RepID=UPI00222585DB|nr:uncharacterized protein F5J12DRAFT_742713 [Pisolithus orientalis]KAI6006209.1 hypothetical protein F5J12DRAFT_742713 [Pisolithus orientalis]